MSSGATRRWKPRWPRSSPIRLPTGRPGPPPHPCQGPGAPAGAARRRGGVPAANPDIRSVHLAAVAYLRAAVEAFETLAAAYETDDAAAFAATEAKLDDARRHAGAWQAGLANLLAAAGMPVQEATGTTIEPGTAAIEPSPSAPTTTASAPPTELISNARAEASATAPDSVDDAGNPVGYDAANVLDGDPSTAWRVKGTGRGAVVAIRLPAPARITQRSEERRVGKECRSRWSPYH